MSYVGIARRLSQGQFHAAINAFRSPLISWIIAAGSRLDGNLLQVGKFTNIGSFLASAALLMGIGGLHSSEKSVAFFSDAENDLVDRDVASYYPRILLNCQLAP